MSNHYLYICAHSNYFTVKRYCGPFKVGISRNPKSRLRDVQTGNPNPVEVIWQSRGMDREMGYIAERFLHELLRDHRMEGEWFNLPPNILWTMVGYVENAIREAGRLTA